jgi:hypothetical protein
VRTTRGTGLKAVARLGRRGGAALAVAAGWSMVLTGPAGAATGGLDQGGKSARTGTDSKLQDITAMVGSTSPGRSRGSGPSRCTYTPGRPSTTAGLKVSWELGKEPFKFVESNGSTRLLYGRRCGGGETTWVWVPQASPRELAEVSADSVRQRLPAPRAVFSPDPTDAGVVVQLPMWFAIPANQWTEVSETASVPGLSATVTARPMSLRFEPGDGSQAVKCRGPGLRWRPGMPEPAKAPACSHTYRDASSVAPGGTAWSTRLSITWRVSWTSSTGAGGSLGTLTTSQAYPVRVREIQAIETGDG